MAWINLYLEEFIKDCFPDRNVYAYHEYRTWQSSRYLYVTTFIKNDNDLHYEYIGGSVELHLEGKYQSFDYKDFAKELRQRTSRNPKLHWLSWQGRSQCRCRLDASTDNWGQLREAFKEIMDIFDPIIKEITQKTNVNHNVEPYHGETIFTEENLNDDEVSLVSECPLGRLFGNNLVIPDYQRNYCWEDKQVNDLWKSMQEIPREGKYHLGTIILQKDSNGNYAIIDGQQRLVTLTLMIRELNYQGEMPLLEQKFLSENSKNHIENTRWLIKQLKSKSYSETLCSRIINKLIFTVLILKEHRLDLAYTFFSNENSKGVPLSDYDLLKAHHLRYIFIEKQAEHLAGRWNNMLENEFPAIEKTLATHLFRLRKWMRKKNFNPKDRFCVKEEFSSALIIPEIPPFGEKFDFYEKIQGGTHFFAYTEHFVNKYKLFSDLRQVKALRNHIDCESHWKYADVIETLLFCYYLKFGKQYLSEALFCISSYMAQHRYEASRALAYKIREYANNSEIVMMIDQASSPTFFLAECADSIKASGRDIEEQGIAMRFYQRLQDLFAEICDDFSDLTIIEKYNNEY
ncbi:MAG: DUF262 domain-containing protein [Bacteroidales bacterium]|nr:DUF262 domain-containing protein [Bacteroidales bacterium]